MDEENLTHRGGADTLENQVGHASACQPRRSLGHAPAKSRRRPGLAAPHRLGFHPNPCATGAGIHSCLSLWARGPTEMHENPVPQTWRRDSSLPRRDSSRRFSGAGGTRVTKWVFEAAASTLVSMLYGA